MKYPNQRYGNPQEFVFYCRGKPINIIAKQLKRSTKTIERYLSGKTKIPWWVNEYLRLADAEHNLRLQYMTNKKVLSRLGIVRGELIEFKQPATKIVNPNQEIPKQTVKSILKEDSESEKQLSLQFYR